MFLDRCVFRGDVDPEMLVIDWDEVSAAIIKLSGSDGEMGVLRFALALATDQFCITSLDEPNRAAMVQAMTTATARPQPVTARPAEIKPRDIQRGVIHRRAGRTGNRSSRCGAGRAAWWGHEDETNPRRWTAGQRPPNRPPPLVREKPCSGRSDGPIVLPTRQGRRSAPKLADR